MNRPWALTQWLARAPIAEDFVLMTEPDHVFIAAPPLTATLAAPSAAPFWYVDCAAAKYRQHCENATLNAGGVAPEDVAMASCLFLFRVP